MVRLAVSATFTATPLERLFSFWAKQLGWSVETVFAPYGRLHESIVDPAGVLAHNSSGANLILLRWEDLGPDDAARGTNGRAAIADLLRQQYRVPLVLSLGPSLAAASEEFAQWVQLQVPDLLTPASVSAHYPVSRIFSEQGDRLGHVPYTEEFFAAWGTALFRRVHRLLSPPVKVIVTDADDTLWSGVCGEDGPTGIALTGVHRNLQERLQAQRAAGRLLALASKNNPEDLEAAFSAHPDFPLSLADFAARRVGWGEKSRSLEEMAGELSLGLNSFALIDDSSKECAAISASHPEVITLPLPADSAAWGEFLDHVWAFDQGPVTTEDRQRADSYRSVAAFEEARVSATSLDDFYRGLDLRVEFRPVLETELPRAAQLTQRTNQFNCTTIRRSEAELRSLIADGWTVSVARVTDRFGDYGLTGVVIARPADGGTYDVDTFLLSCRVLGRGVEHEIVRRLAEAAAAQGCPRLRIRFAPTAVNEPARQFLAQLPAAGDNDREAAVEALQGLRFSATPAVAPALPSPAGPKTPMTLFRDYARIAVSLRTPSQILDALRGHWTPPADAAQWTETERRLAQLWAELLRTPDIQPSSNFFDLGGHSLLAVLLLTRIQEVFGAEVSIDAVYDAGVTLASLAARIDAAHHTDLTEEEYAALVAEIESLSDEEVQALLNQPGGSS